MYTVTPTSLNLHMTLYNNFLGTLHDEAHESELHIHFLEHKQTARDLHKCKEHSQTNQNVHSWHRRPSSPLVWFYCSCGPRRGRSHSRGWAWHLLSLADSEEVGESQVYEPHWMIWRGEAWQVFLHGKMAVHHGTGSCEPSVRQLSCSDDYKLELQGNR